MMAARAAAPAAAPRIGAIFRPLLWLLSVFLLREAQAGPPQAQGHASSTPDADEVGGQKKGMSRDVTGEAAQAWGTATDPELRKTGDFGEVYEAMRRHLASADAGPPAAIASAGASAPAATAGAASANGVTQLAARSAAAPVQPHAGSSASSGFLGKPSQPASAPSAQPVQLKIAASEQTQGQHNESRVPEEPRVFFLFLTRGGIEREDIWKEWFKFAPVGRYRIIMHCSNSDLCGLNNALNRYQAKPHTLNIKLVDTVPSEYCKDLVSPMVALLQAAIAESGQYANQDKFVFVSESTMPIKNFDAVYSALTASPTSDFCISKAESWADFHMTPDASLFTHESLLKHSQWVVLNKEHAKTMVDRWGTVNSGEGVFWSVPIWFAKDGYDQGKWSTIRESNVCADEWVIFASVFGVLRLGPRDTSVAVPGISLAPGQTDVSLHGPPAESYQGVCRTFASWGYSAGENTFELVKTMMDSADNTRLSCWPNCASSSPIEFMSISDQDLLKLKQSSFLFARKFDPKAVTLDQFTRLILPP